MHEVAFDCIFDDNLMTTEMMTTIDDRTGEGWTEPISRKLILIQIIENYWNIYISELPLTVLRSSVMMSRCAQLFILIFLDSDSSSFRARS